MPNLISYIDTSEYYHEQIRDYYEFIEVEIAELNFKLFHFEGIDKGSNIHLYLLTDSNENNLAILRLAEITLHGKIYYQICKSYAVISQKGYGEQLYNLCFSLHKDQLVSDHINTFPGSFNLWKKILRKNDRTAIRYDSKNNRKYKMNLKNEFLIWGVPDNFLEIIRETEWQAVIFENEYEDLDYGDNDEIYDNIFVDYLSENDKIERTLLSDYVVKALKEKKKIKDRKDILILV